MVVEGAVTKGGRQVHLCVSRSPTRWFQGLSAAVHGCHGIYPAQDMKTEPLVNIIYLRHKRIRQVWISSSSLNKSIYQYKMSEPILNINKT